MTHKPPFSFLIKKRTLLLLILPSLIFYLAFFIYPILVNLMLAFTNMSIYHFYQYDFIGLANFIEMFSSPKFYIVMEQTFLWVICTVSLQVVLGLFFALFFTSPSLKGRTIYRGLMLLPWAVPNIVMILVWKGMFNPTFGVINFILGKNIPWTTSPDYAFWMIQIINIWLAYPFLMLLLTGAIQSIPTEFIELADVFGCNILQKIRYIILPVVMPVLSYGVIQTSGTAFMQFPVIWLLTRGGPGGSTDVIMTWAYTEALNNYAFGYHAAIAMFASFISLIFAFLAIRKGKILEGV